MSLSMRLSISADPEPDQGEIVMTTSDVDDTATTPHAQHTNGNGNTNGNGPSATAGDVCAGLPEFDNKRAKIDYFSQDCSAITEYLYVSGKKVASSEAKLREKGITHVINAAGDVCENYFPEQFHYLKLHLLDSAHEDIMSVLYKVIDFIDAVRKARGRVLIHCQQGVSRSTVLVIAYLMYFENSDYNTIYEFVRARRGICRPNVGFMCQLLAWRKRVTLGWSRPHCLYRIAPHNLRDRSLVTKFVDRVELASLDSRTLFMLQINASASDSASAASTPSATVPASAASLASTLPTTTPATSGLIVIWCGMLCPRAHEKQYLPYLAHLIEKIQRHEHAGKHVVIVRQKGREKLEKAEQQVRGGPSPKMTSPSRVSPTPTSPSTVPSFSSELISASFHTLEAAPAVLAANSLSCLYPAATAKEAALFYRIMGLEESDDFARVGSDSSHAISSAILINDALNEDYSDVPIPDVTLLNDVAWRTANGATPSSPSKPWIVPPIVRVGLRRRPDEDEDATAPMDDAFSDADIAARFNRSPSTTAGLNTSSPVKLQLPGRQSDEHESPSIGITLPKQLFVSATSSANVTPRIVPSSPTTTKPRLSLGLAGIRNGGDDDAMDESDEISTISILSGPSPNLTATSARLTPTPLAVGEAAAASLASPHHHVLASPSSLRSPLSSHASSPYTLYEFPNFEAGPLLAYTRATLAAPRIFLLHHAPANGASHVFVWMAPGSRFIPSRFEGDRDAFAADIARIFQHATSALVDEVHNEIAGKESDAFWAGFDR